MSNKKFILVIICSWLVIGTYAVLSALTMCNAHAAVVGGSVEDNQKAFDIRMKQKRERVEKRHESNRRSNLYRNNK